MATYAHPGVYTFEFTPGAPIQGVGTSVAAFVGPAQRGPGGPGDLSEPTKITSFDQFKQTFGDQPLSGFFLWYAVRGFFENGGKTCYVVRVSNGTHTQGDLPNTNGAAVIHVRALDPGPKPLLATITAASLLPNAVLYAPAAVYQGVIGRQVTLVPGDGAKFRPADRVLLDNSPQPVTIVQIAGDILRIDQDVIPAPVPNRPIRLADAVPGTTVLRIQMQPAGLFPKGVLMPGTLLTIQQGAPSESVFVDSVQSEGGAVPTMRVTLRRPLTVGFSLDPAQPAAAVQSQEFGLQVTGSTLHDNLSIDPAHPRYFADLINGSGSEGDKTVRVDPVEPPPTAPPGQSLPAVVNNLPLTVGTNENLATLLDIDFTGALDRLRQVDDVNLVAVPDRTTIVVQQAVIQHCENLADRFAVLDAQPSLDLFGATGVEQGQRPGLDSTRGYAALYYPWIRVTPAGAGAPILVPPSGHVCGVMAATDQSRGVHKAPANVIVGGALDVERTMSETDHGILNLDGINVIRRFHAGSRPVIYGARTTATDTNWQYVNIRRLFLYLEKSIQVGIRWAVFEPNNTALWEKLRRSITDFLTGVWRDGALFGETADKAFYVRIDEKLNPDSERALGRLHIEIGVRPSYPAEFIIVNIGIWYGGSDVSES